MERKSEKSSNEMIQEIERRSREAKRERERRARVVKIRAGEGGRRRERRK
jgi:hypothetical protein